MNRFLFSLLTLCILLTGCLSRAWQGYKKPIESDFDTVKGMNIGKQNLSPRQWQAIKEATSDVCDLFADAEFKQHVISKNWLASCERVHGKQDTISGVEVYKMLAQPIPKFSIHPHKPWHAEAQTDNDEQKPERNRVAIDPAEIEGWYSVVDSTKAILINTIAHEVVHIISYRFLDYDGLAPSACADSMLVSYAVGDLAAEIWLKRHKK